MKLSRTEYNECREELDVLINAINCTSQWRERVELNHGMKPPVAYHRILLLLALHQTRDGAPMTISRLAQNVRITETSLVNIARRMAFDGVAVIETDPNDRDIKTLSLTRDGMNMAAA